LVDLRKEFLRREAPLGYKKISNRKTPPAETLRRRDEAQEEKE
jgi:hypothetical protein